MGYDSNGFSTSVYNGINLDEYNGWQLSDYISKYHDAQQEFKFIVNALFSRGSLDKATLENSLDILGDLLAVDIPKDDLQIERKNETLTSIQFLLTKQQLPIHK